MIQNSDFYFINIKLFKNVQPNLNYLTLVIGYLLLYLNYYFIKIACLPRCLQNENKNNNKKLATRFSISNRFSI